MTNYFVKNAGHEAQVQALTARKAALVFLSEMSRTDGAALGCVVCVSKAAFHLSQKDDISFFGLKDLLDDLGVDVSPTPSRMCLVRDSDDIEQEPAVASKIRMVLCM
jgi:hypothetical protein